MQGTSDLKLLCPALLLRRIIICPLLPPSGAFIPGAAAAPASPRARVPLMTAASYCSRCCYLRFCDGILPLQVLHHSFQLPVLVFRSCQPCLHLRDDVLLRSQERVVHSDGGLLRCQGCLELRHHLRKLPRWWWNCCGCGGAGRSCAGRSGICCS